MKKQFRAFKNSFKNLKTGKYLKVISADILMVVFFALITWILGAIIQAKTSALIPLADFDFTQMTPEVQAYAGQLQSFAVVFIISALVWLLLVILAWSVTQAYVWNTINSRKHVYNFYRKSFLINLFLVPLFLIILAISAVIVLLARYALFWILFNITTNIIVLNAFTIIASVLLFIPPILYVINSLNLTYHFLSKTNSLGKSVSEMLESIKLRHYIPHVLMTAVIIIASLASLIFRFNETVYLWASIILFILFFGWMRFYLKEIVRQG